MSIPLDTALSTEVDEQHLLKKDHRNKSPEKSQWVLSRDEEVLCFTVSIRLGWHDANEAWGLWLHENTCTPLGESAKRLGAIRKLKLAKFINGGEPVVWHGYPADYVANKQDRPSISVLTMWKAKGLISKTEFAKIRQGQKCSLSE